MLFCLFLFLVFTVYISYSFAEQKEITLDLRTAVAIGIKNNKTVLLPREVSYIQSVVEYKLNRAEYKPQISFIGESNLSSSNILKLNISETLIPYLGTNLTLGVDKFFIYSTTDESSFYITFSQPLSLSTILPSILSEKSLKFNYQQAYLEYRFAKQNLIVDIISSYLSLLKTMRNFARAEELLRSTEEMKKIVELKVQSGLVAEAELDSMRLQYNLDLNEFEQQKEELRRQKEEFNRLLGLPLNTELLLEQDISVNRSTFSFDECLNIAMKNNLEIKNAEFQKYSAKINLMAVEYMRLPQLSVEGMYKSFFTPSYSVDEQDRRNFNILFKLNLPLYSGGVYKYKYLQAKHNMKLAEFNVEDIKYRVEKELRDIFFQRELNKRQLISMKESKTMAENMLKVAEIKLKNGMISYQDWQFIVDKYKQADQAYYDAQTEDLLLYVKLLRTMGICEEDVLWK